MSLDLTEMGIHEESCAAYTYVFMGMGSDMAWMHGSTHAPVLYVLDDRMGDIVVSIDGGATRHLIYTRRMFSTSSVLTPPKRLNIANESFLIATHNYQVRLHIEKADGRWEMIMREDVFYYANVDVFICHLPSRHTCNS